MPFCKWLPFLSLIYATVETLLQRVLRSWLVFLLLFFFLSVGVCGTGTIPQLTLTGGGCQPFSTQRRGRLHQSRTRYHAMGTVLNDENHMDSNAERLGMGLATAETPKIDAVGVSDPGEPAVVCR